MAVCADMGQNTISSTAGSAGTWKHRVTLAEAGSSDNVMHSTTSVSAAVHVDVAPQ